jgi:hypothetical protein
MLFSKGNLGKLFSKQTGDKLLGAAKSASKFFDNDLVNMGVTALAPELGIGLAAARRAGVLEKIKNA